jgi:hypothetical protein
MTADKIDGKKLVGVAAAALAAAAAIGWIISQGPPPSAPPVTTPPPVSTPPPSAPPTVPSATTYTVTSTPTGASPFNFGGGIVLSIGTVLTAAQVTSDLNAIFAANGISGASIFGQSITLNASSPPASTAPVSAPPTTGLPTIPPGYYLAAGPFNAQSTASEWIAANTYLQGLGVWIVNTPTPSGNVQTFYVLTTTA